MTPESVIEAIRAELRRRGSNPYRLARESGLPENSIRYLLDGHEPRVGRLIEVCDALGLQFYVGPPARTGLRAPPSDEATAAARRLEQLESSAHALNRVVIEAGGDPLPADLRPALNAGRPEDFDLGDTSYRRVTIVDLASAAGDGSAVPLEEAKGFVLFSDDWLRRHRLDPVRCSIIRVRGESMEPTLPDGCSILVDHTTRSRSSERIFVVRTNDEVVVKRCVKGTEGWRLVSDHPAWHDSAWPGDAEIVGQVRWMCATL